MEPCTKQFLPMPPQDPNSPSSSTSSSSSSSTSPSHPYHRAQPPHPHNLPPSPRPVPRTIETTPFPTTFVQADTTSFKQVVQMLTGSEQSSKNAAAATTAAGNGSAGNQAASGSGPCRPKKPSFKLYERRSSLKNLKMIAPLAMGAPPSPRNASAAPEILSPSVLDFPSLKLSSPVTPLTGDPFFPSPASSSGDAAERAAIADKGFFFHPSPRGAEPPRLLPLFPVSSPRMAAASATAAPAE
ncbi:VQ motif-containing protein 4-like [Triticum dicoccoides]|uniref:VQ domain-containing protein n=2 Tax=Triticum aestivum TaxID=4565 RepID=A0A077RZF2_WHEAT|nr:VQ motif-containing protein 4-like [Triticum dicoccoides]XP_044349831.1 VQ motif-containing protein 4-like [Triticum aestivum]CDM83987.1 unnamed protein product [Triticum aestivum]